MVFLCKSKYIIYFTIEAEFHGRRVDEPAGWKILDLYEGWVAEKGIRNF